MQSRQEPPTICRHSAKNACKSLNLSDRRNCENTLEVEFRHHFDNPVPLLVIRNPKLRVGLRHNAPGGRLNKIQRQIVRIREGVQRVIQKVLCLRRICSLIRSLIWKFLKTPSRS